MSSSTPPLQPTYYGFINTTLDASMVFEATFTGQCNHVPRRPHDRERQDLIKSGNVFIYEEHASGIKRWTDSLSWSPSRILGNFLIYRELERPFPPGEKKRALKKGKKPSSTGINKPQEQHPRASTSLPTGMEVRRNNTPIDEVERSLVGSLVDSYDFKPGGLIKKTISITYKGVPHHLVSYYSVEDVRAGRLIAPSVHPAFQGTIPRSELLTQQNFRSPIDNTEQFYSLHGAPHGHDQRMSLYQQISPPQDYRQINPSQDYRQINPSQDYRQINPSQDYRQINSPQDYSIGPYGPPAPRSLTMTNQGGQYRVPADFSPPQPPQSTPGHMQNWANNYFYNAGI